MARKRRRARKGPKKVTTATVRALKKKLARIKRIAC
jgi:hypothetical protein